MEHVRIFIGYDPREAVAYHACCQSIIDTSSVPVSFHPLALTLLRGYKETHKDGSNEFIYSRFLVPYLCDFNGWAMFLDGDMIVNRDIADLWALRNPWAAVQVVKHSYKTKHATKYLGAKNEDYPCKNWSSVMLWNCGHYANRKLTQGFVEGSTGAELHRFTWLPENRVGALPPTWNHLVSEYDKDDYAALYHYTVGTPCFMEFAKCDNSDKWWNAHGRMVNPL